MPLSSTALLVVLATASPASPAEREVSTPLEAGAPRPPSSDADGPPAGTEPLDGSPRPAERAGSGVANHGATPFKRGPKPRAKKTIPPRLLRLVRIDYLVGMVWRLQRTEPIMTASVEFGRQHGFSAAFHTSMIIAPDRDFVGVIDFPIGFGAIARGTLKNRPLFGSIGLTAGVLVHRANTDLGVVHRVDPDFRLPVRFAWTAARFGLSLAIVQGYSVRRRSYERRGVEVWSRHPYRVSALVGLHFDLTAGRAKSKQSARTRRH